MSEDGPTTRKPTEEVGRSRARRGKPAAQPERPDNPALPAPSEIVEERLLISPKGTRFRVLRTREKDPYDPP